MTELYSGEFNTINFQTLNQAQFVCFFDNINMYPFGDQKCSMSFFIKGADNKLVNMEESNILMNVCLFKKDIDSSPSTCPTLGQTSSGRT